MNPLRLIVTVMIIGCLSLSHNVLAAGHAKYSGFIDSYPELKKDQAGVGGLIYRKEGVNLAEYDKVMIEPIEIWLSPDSEYKGFSPDDFKAITDEFYHVLVANLEPNYPVVSRPGKGVLVLRLAITDVHAKKKKRGLFGYTPIGLVAGAVSGKYRHIKLSDATIEAEMLDAETLDQLGVLVDKLSASKGTDNKGDETSWDEISENLGFYARRFRSRLDAAHKQ